MLNILFFIIISIPSFGFINETIQQEIAFLEKEKQKNEEDFRNIEKQISEYTNKFDEIEQENNRINSKISSLNTSTQIVQNFERNYTNNENFPHLRKWYKAYLNNDSLKMSKHEAKFSQVEKQLMDGFVENRYKIKNSESIDVLNNKKTELTQKSTTLKKEYFELSSQRIQLSNRNLELKNEIQSKQYEIYSCDGSDEVRLDKTPISKKFSVHGPLENVPVLDQDGLGTCYANAAALLYKSSYPEQPLLSYLDFALNYKANAKSNYDKNDLKLSGGDSCSTFYFIKGKELCESEGSLLENGKVYDFDRQIDIIYDVAKFIDGFNHSYDSDLSKKLKQNSENFLKLNPYDNFDYSSMLSAEIKIFDELQRKVKWDSDFRLKAGDKIKEFDNKLDFYLRHIYPPALIKKEIKDFSAFEKSFNEYFKDYPFALNDFSQNKEKNKNDFLSDIKNYNNIKKYWDRMPENNQVFMTTLDINSCLSEKQLMDLTSYFEAIKSAKDQVDNVLFKLISSESDDFEIIRKMIHPNCKKYKIPENIKCHHYAGNDVKKFRYEILSNLYSEKPKGVGIDYCANVLENITYDSRSLRKCDGMLGQSYHASVITGARKKAEGEGCEYLVQNSWGADCDKYYDPKKCEDGKIWISEEALMKNYTSIYSLGEM
jgi:hypothetical protein